MRKKCIQESYEIVFQSGLREGKMFVSLNGLDFLDGR